MVEFTCIEDFFSEELRSQYVTGLSYTAREEDEKLLALLPKWKSEGKIVYGRAAVKVAGAGETK